MKRSGPEERRERGFYTLGLALSVVLTVAPPFAGASHVGSRAELARCPAARR